VVVHGQGGYLVFEFGRFAGAGRPKQYEGSWIEALNNAGYSVAGAALGRGGCFVSAACSVACCGGGLPAPTVLQSRAIKQRCTPGGAEFMTRHDPPPPKPPGIDNQGAGRSQGRFGLIKSFDRVVDDLLQLTDLLRGPAAPQGFGAHLPAFGVGCSLGGCIALLASMRRPGLFKGLVLLAPMLSLERIKKAGINRILV
jgi:hypothetical protein